jgi:hypothetical protein
MWTKDGQKIIVEESQKNLVVEAITVLIIAGLSLFIEQRKATEVIKSQQLIDDFTPEHIEAQARRPVRLCHHADASAVVGAVLVCARLCGLRRLRRIKSATESCVT